MDNVLFEFKRGRTYTRDFTITGYNDNIDNVLFTVCENEEDKNYVLRKSLDNGITIVDEGIDEEGNNFKTYNILINATDTDKMKTNKEYAFDIVIYSNDFKLPVINGVLNLLSTSTKTYNE